MHKLFALMLLAFGSGTVSACSCPTKTMEGYVQDAEAVYIATLFAATSIAGLSGKFRVDKVFKGKVSEKFVTLETNDAGAMCGVFLVVPAMYLIFTSNDSNGLSGCNGTTIIVPFDEEEISKKISAALALPAPENKPDDVAPQTAQ